VEDGEGDLWGKSGGWPGDLLNGSPPGTPRPSCVDVNNAIRSLYNDVWMHDAPLQQWQQILHGIRLDMRITQERLG
jgi:hypothetical protein